MIGGTSGSEAKLFQPSRSQSKITQARSVSFGSRNTTAPFEPCCLRFSAPLVEKTLVKRSKSSTVVVARSIPVLLYVSGVSERRRGWGEYVLEGARRHRAIALWRDRLAAGTVVSLQDCDRFDFDHHARKRER